MASKTPKMTKALEKILKDVCEQTSKQLCAYVDNRAQPLVELGYITIMEDDTDDCGDMAAYANDSGMEYCGYTQTIDNESDGEQVTEETNEKIEFKIEYGIPMPKKKAGGGSRPTKYPLADMEVNGSIHLPLCEKYPNPARTLASTASRFNKLHEGERRYEVRPVDHTDPEGEGARVWRIK
jgi:hypothetical protein